MSEQKRNNEVDEAASALIENSESVFENTEVKAANKQVATTKSNDDDVHYSCIFSYRQDTSFFFIHFLKNLIHDTVGYLQINRFILFKSHRRHSFRLTTSERVNSRYDSHQLNTVNRRKTTEMMVSNPFTVWGECG